MKAIKIPIIIISLIIVGACSTSKKATTSTSSATPPPNSSAANISFSVFKPEDTKYQPGMQELAAIQAQYKDVTMDLLNEGHTIYTKGECINCHGAKDIFRIEVANWPHILDNMAKRAKISDAQKDAVNKFFLAIKATQK